MRTTFSGIEIARRAVTAQQRSLDTVGHNVANVNTPGYSRQRAIHTAANPFPMPSLAHTPSSGQMGVGVKVAEVVQMRDAFAETRLRQELHNLGYWERLEGGLSQVERIFNEPSENGIDNALDMYWNSLQDLSQNPEDEAVRNVVVQRAEVLTETIRYTYRRLHDLRSDTNHDVAIKVDAINAAASQIAALNGQIARIAATGNNPNDLLDKRTLLLEELSSLVDIGIVTDARQMVDVTIGGVSLVNGSDTRRLVAEPTVVSGDGVNGSYTRNEILWASASGTWKAEIQGGEIGGMLEFRDQRLEGYMSQLNQWAASLLASVNERHAEGYPHPDAPEGDLPFFVTHPAAGASADLETARNIRLNPDLAANVWRMQASDVPGVVGNGGNALHMAQLRYERFADGSESTLAESFNALISGLGVRTQEAKQMVETEEVLVNHLQNLKEATSGVNLDEEMADMIRFQHSYNAAARLMTAMDEALDVIINRLGLVGR